MTSSYPKPLSDLYTFLQQGPEYLRKKNYDHISYRTFFIRKLLENNRLKPMIDSTFNKLGKSNDIREVMGRKSVNFNEFMESISCKLLYIKSGSTGHTFRGIIGLAEGQPHWNCAVKIVAYPRRERYGCINDIKRPENAEIIMLKLLSDLVVRNQTPHIILPMATFTTNIKPFINLSKYGIVNHKRYKEFVTRYEKGDFYENVSVLISEWANGGDFLDYLRKNFSDLKLIQWRVLFFQIVSVLAVIQSEYPDFRHNDLKGNNILVHRIESHKKNKHKYIIDGISYSIPNIGIQVKIWDFDFASIPSKIRNSKVEAKWTDKINVKPVRNQYYDLHFFFNTLTKKGFVPDIFISDKVPEQVKTFIRRVVPDHLTTGPNVSDKGRLLIDTEYTTPKLLLKDEFFESFVSHVET